MVYRRMLYFYWMPIRVVQAMYTSRSVDMYHVIKRLKMSFACQLYQWFSILYRLTKVIVLVGKMNMFFLENT